ncbi:MAG: hypothetical protein ISR69_04525 [Gammaproteobacteria bacterium]|nr:hypothetical protein [Gammaproteobacteria bacterium]
MSNNNNVMNPALARQMFQKSERLKLKRLGKPAALESFPRVLKTITNLWRYAECQTYLEEIIMVEGGSSRQGFPNDVQEELMFVYQLLLDQYKILGMRGQNMKTRRPPGTKFTMGA